MDAQQFEAKQLCIKVTEKSQKQKKKKTHKNLLQTQMNNCSDVFTERKKILSVTVAAAALRTHNNYTDSCITWFTV